MKKLIKIKIKKKSNLIMIQITHYKLQLNKHRAFEITFSININISHKIHFNKY